MTAEFGGLNGIFEPDERGRGVARCADDAATTTPRATTAPTTTRPTSRAIRIDLASLGAADRQALLAGQRLRGRGAHRAGAATACFIGACTTTEEELALGALVLERALADGAEPAPVESGRRIVVPGDLIDPEALRRTWGCGRSTSAPASSWIRRTARCAWASPAARRGKGEVWLSSQNRNFENRMGEGSLAWLASAATVAASALSMRVDRPAPAAGAHRPRSAGHDPPAPTQRAAGRDHDHGAGDRRWPRERAGTERGRRSAGGVIRARVQRFGDSVDTDAIIPGEFCHLTDLTELGEKAFYYVRPEFRRAREGWRDHRRRGRGLGQRQLARDGGLGAARYRHPGRDRQELRLHPQAQPRQRGAAVPRHPRRGVLRPGDRGRGTGGRSRPAASCAMSRRGASSRRRRPRR